MTTQSDLPYFAARVARTVRTLLDTSHPTNGRVEEQAEAESRAEGIAQDRAEAEYARRDLANRNEPLR